MTSLRARLHNSSFTPEIQRLTNTYRRKILVSIQQERAFKSPTTSFSIPSGQHYDRPFALIIRCPTAFNACSSKQDLRLIGEIPRGFKFGHCCAYAHLDLMLALVHKYHTIYIFPLKMHAAINGINVNNNICVNISLKH